MICAISCASFHGTARRTQNPSHIDSWRRRICYKSIQRWAAAFQSIAARRFARSYSDHIASSIAWITNRRLSRLRAALRRSDQAIDVSPAKNSRRWTQTPHKIRVYSRVSRVKKEDRFGKTLRKLSDEARALPKSEMREARVHIKHRTSNIKHPDHAAVKRTTFFLPSPDSASFFDGRKVSSRYFVACSTRSRLELKPSLCLMFSRWLSIVFTLRFRE